MRDLARQFLREARTILLAVLASVVAVAVSFLFTGGLAYQTFSDRLLWVGMALSMLGGLVALGQRAHDRTRQAYGEHGTEGPRAPQNEAGHAPRAERPPELRYGTVFRFWIMGAACIALSALVSLLGG